MNEDQLIRRGEVTGDAIGTCDFCGQPIAIETIEHVTVDPGRGERVETVRACPACGQAITRDDVPFDAEIAAGLQAPDE
jgi:hypothetical protein